MKRNVTKCLLIAALAAASSVASAQVDPIAEANKRKAEAEADKAASEADKAASEAETAATKAKFGPLADYTREGSVSAGEGSGQMEAQLMASDATQALAGLMVERLESRELMASGAKILIATDSERPTFEAYDAFIAQANQITYELDRARKIPVTQKSKPGVIKMGTSSLPALLSIAGNLLRSDYEIAAVKWTADDILLARALVFQAKELGMSQKYYTASVASSAMSASNPAVAELAKLGALQASAETDLGSAKTGAEANKKLDYSKKIAALEAAIKRSDEFSAFLRTAVSGLTPLVVIARQAQLAELLDGGYLLTIKTHAAGGSTFTKKNFWTFLGTMPFFVSGGALASYSLSHGTSGEVLDSAVFGQVQPFMKVHAVSKQGEGN